MIRRTFLTLCLGFGSLAIVPALGWAAEPTKADPAKPDGNWPVWRGPTHNGVSAETGFPTKWSSTENVAWKTPIPGKGHSSPIIWGDRIFLTSCLEDAVPDKSVPKDRLLLCINRKDGKILWQKTVISSKLEGIHKLNSFASSTPATDGKHVFVTFFDQPRVQVYCYDFEGNLVWNKSPGEFHSKHGFCSPPILYKNLVIINGDQDAKAAYVVAYDKATGEEKYRIPRPGIRSYCPPLIVEAAGKMQMVLTGAKTVASYDPDTGKQHWIIDGPTEQFVATMIYHKGLFFLTAGFPTYHVMAIKPDGTGNVTKTHVAWHDQKGKGAGYVPSPVAHGDHIFLVKDESPASCRDALTGDIKWIERLGKHHSASPVVADGRVFYLDDDGIMWVVKASATFEVEEKNILGENCYASPAFSKGQIFIRGSKHLFCIGKGTN